MTSRNCFRRWFRGLTAAALVTSCVLAACTSGGSGVGGESHFVCEDDADCIDVAPDLRCLAGKCVAAGGPCGGSPLVGKHLWKVGNCEVGTTSAFDASTCEATLCGGNARTPGDCTGQNLFTVRVDGLELTGPPDLEVTLRRDVECGATPGVSADVCPRYSCLLEQMDELYVAVHRGDREDPDPLWMAADAPWPGTEACRQPTPRMETAADACADAN